MKTQTHFRKAQSTSEKIHSMEIESPDFILHHVLKHYQTMIVDSNLCWAACMESLIKGYQTDSKIGTEQYQIADYYQEHFCKNQQSRIDQIAMKDRHYVSMFSLAGFHISSLNLEYLESYKDVKSSLQNNVALIVRSLENELSHILIIIGYKQGKYFVMDPDSNSKRFYYWAYKNIIVKYGVEKLWAVSAA